MRREKRRVTDVRRRAERYDDLLQDLALALERLRKEPVA